MEITKNKSEEKSTEKAYAYTPSLKAKRDVKVIKTRLLPIPGETIVEKGEEVDFDTIVAKTFIAGKPVLQRAADILGIKNEDLPPFMVKKEKEEVEEGEIVAKFTPFFGLIKRFVRSPTRGIIESISDATGQILFREPPTPVYLRAYIRGRISDIILSNGVIIETQAAFIQGIFGIGGEKHGNLLMVAKSPDEILTEEKIESSLRGKILVGGSQITFDALKKAEDLGVCGIIVGGVIGLDLKRFMGYEIGVAITGHEDINITLIITEGFGNMAMSKRTFDILKEFEGYEAAINGATQIRAGVIRPEIIIPHDKKISRDVDEDLLAGGMGPGTPIRIISDPYFGKIGTVVSLPVNLQKVETESHVRVIQVKIDEGIVTIPRANVEIVEE